eukprot:3017226-Lingulodinium_polyedra.AAC.1
MRSFARFQSVYGRPAVPRAPVSTPAARAAPAVNLPLAGSYFACLASDDDSDYDDDPAQWWGSEAPAAGYSGEAAHDGDVSAFDVSDDEHGDP